MAAYFAEFTPDKEQGGYVVTFPDVPGCVTQGDNDVEAMEMAADALCLILSHIVEHGGEIPESRVRRGKHFRLVSLPPLESAKLDLYRVFRASGLRKAELARRMGILKSNVDRLFDLNHTSRIENLDAAFRALGKRLVVRVEDAA
jgi:antitoxin HicB